jgi:acetyl esterase/lipase
MKQLKSLFTILLFNILVINSYSQTATLKLWPAGIPGSIKSESFIEKPSLTNGDVTWIVDVSDPELFVFLPPSEKATGTAVLICPGGGYAGLAIAHEGYAIAKWLNDNGIAGIILKYRIPSDLIMKDKSVGPLQDAQEAMRVIRRNAKVWKLNPDHVGVIGFSAGGHLASTLSTHFEEKVYDVADNTSARPDFSVLIYPVISFDASFTHAGSRSNLIGENADAEEIKHFSNELQITGKTPPAFLVHSADDEVVPVKNSMVYFEGIQKFKSPSELHIFRKGGHGYGLSVGKGTQSAWPAMCLNWIKEIIKQ